MGVIARTRWSLRLVFCVAGVVACAASLKKTCFSEEILAGYLNYLFTLVAVLGLIGFLGLSVFCLDILYLDPADSLNTEAFKKLYKEIQKTRLYGRWTIRKFKKGCHNIRTQQEEYLLDLLKHNAETAYGKDNKFSEITNVAEFRTTLPLASYENFWPYVQRISDGETNVLTKDQPLCLAKTSGTTGKAKYIPIAIYNRKSQETYSSAFYYLPVLKGAKLNLKKIVSLGYKPPKIETTKGGLPIGPLTNVFRVTLPYMTSPDCVFQLTHENTAFYVHALFAFREREVGNMALLFAHQAYCFFTYVQQKWQTLCDDIEHGTLTYDDLEIDDELYVQIQNELYPDRKRAEELRYEMRLGAVGLAKRIWPGLTYCRVTTSGSMEPYGRLIQNTYLRDVALVQNAYGASEGVFGMNLSTVRNDPSYTLTYMSGFFEFIPEKNVEEEEPVTLLAHEVIVGRQYELVVTNGFGLCRYRMGDVVKIVGLEGQCPIMEFQYRIGQVLDILGEKTPESVLYKALVQASDRLGVCIIDYTSCEDIHLDGVQVLDNYTRHYVLFIELTRTLKEEETTEFDQALCDVSQIYSDMRRNRQSVTAMEVIQVHRGTFTLLKDRMIRNTQNPQFKMPRALRIKEHLKFLCENKIVDLEQ